MGSGRVDEWAGTARGVRMVVVARRRPWPQQGAYMCAKFWPHSHGLVPHTMGPHPHHTMGRAVAVLQVGAERCMAPEVLFNPSLMDSESPGLAGMVFKCINVGGPGLWAWLSCVDGVECLLPVLCRARGSSAWKWDYHPMRPYAKVQRDHITACPNHAPCILCSQECDIDNRRQLYDGVVLSGGSTMYPGLPSRMEKELKKLYLDHVLKVGAWVRSQEITK